MIDPEIAAARAKQAASAAPFDITKMPITAARPLANAMAMYFNDGTPALAQVETFEIAGPGGPLRARLYRPEAPKRAVLYLHGGGWATCNVDTHDSLMRRLALAGDCSVLGLDFRLAPEHPFPAPLDDAIAAWRWLHANATKLALPTNQLGVAGDSAGANLAIGVSLRERDVGHEMPRATACFYGAFAPTFNTSSYRELGDGRFGLTTERMRWYWTQFLGGTLAAPLLARPLDANLRGLAPIYLGIAALDPIADDSRALAQRLAAANTDCEVDEWPGAVHGFMQMGRDVALARAAIAKAGDFLKRRL
jgi:acetyl esterase